MSYSVREVAAMLGVTPAQIRSYAAKGFLDPERGAKGELRFGFADLIVLRTANELVAAKIPKRKVKKVLEQLREQLPAGQSLTAVRIAADGDRVVVRDGESVWNPESGQALFDFSVAELVNETAAIRLRALTAVEDAEAWFERALDLEQTDPVAAREAYEQTLVLDSDHADAHVNLGRIFHETGNPADAEAHYRLALAQDPEHETALFNLGVALEDLGRAHEAIEAYERALAIDADNADAHYNLAGLYERAGRKADAVNHLKSYRKLVG